MSKTLFTLEAIFAKHGDALLLHYGEWNDPRWILIDGGPPSVYRDFVQPHLEHTRWLYDYADDEPLPLELVMVSHIDADHIAGVLDLLEGMDDARAANRPSPFEIKQLWHNSFDEVIGNKGSGHAAGLLSRYAATADPGQLDDLPLSSELSRETRAVIASTAQGRQLRDAAKRLRIPVNSGWRGLVRRLAGGVKTIDMGSGLKLSVLGPAQDEITKFQKKWDKDLKTLQEKEAEAEAQALADDSPFNLASICVLAEMSGRKMLLTGDARADHVLEGLRQLRGRNPTPGRPFHVDLLKLPHHGSDKNVDENFFRSVTADHYVVSGDGGFGNPEVATLEMIAAARDDDRYTIHFTFPENPVQRRTTPLRKQSLELVDAWVQGPTRPPNCAIRYAPEAARGPSSPRVSAETRSHAVEVDLLDPLYPEGDAIIEVRDTIGAGASGRASSLSTTFDVDRGERRNFLEDLVYRSEDRQRFTQQSPVMPDVWIHYGLSPRRPLDLLLTPDWHSEPAILAQELGGRLDKVPNPEEWKRPRTPKGRDWRPAIASSQNAVVARLWFHEMILAALPLSHWWRDSLCDERREEPWRWLYQPELTAELRRELARSPDEHRHPRLTADVLWFTRVAGVIAHLYQHGRPSSVSVSSLERVRKNPNQLIKALRRCFPPDSKAPKTDFSRPVSLYSVNRNRTSLASVQDSVPAVKGDAAQRLFGVTGKHIRWAIVDSGIDAEHPAFRRLGRTGEPCPEPFSDSGSGRRRPKERVHRNNTRVIATFDFRRIREILSLRSELLPGRTVARARLLELVRDPDPGSEVSLRDRLAKALGIGDRAQRGPAQASEPRMVDWEALEPFLRVEHSAGAYFPPQNPHGTHVAGIMAADWRSADGSAVRLGGMCPELELYDFRVLRDDGTGDEFSIMSAMQFIRHFNTRFEYVAIHGANLSFSIEHDVSNYGCGQTPVCVEAERLVGSGIVVVTAAGNSGRARYLTAHREGGWQTDEGFRTVSITDPGNAQSVITVGATHRRDPHTYGVSYFSSRGPTGDGRVKPDLVAPGEKIRSTVPSAQERVLDGTSMAAPHVSGAAALLLSRHNEFIGNPAAIKDVLCDSATDLGRERYFQGAGLLDILRALQSV